MNRIVEITKTLRSHGIDYSIENGRILAVDVYTHLGIAYANVADITDYSITDLREWLGY